MWLEVALATTSSWWLAATVVTGVAGPPRIGVSEEILSGEEFKVFRESTEICGEALRWQLPSDAVVAEAAAAVDGALAEW